MFACSFAQKPFKFLPPNRDGRHLMLAQFLGRQRQWFCPSFRHIGARDQLDTVSQRFSDAGPMRTLPHLARAQTRRVRFLC